MLEVQEIGSVHENVKAETNTALPLLRADKRTQIVTFHVEHGLRLSTLPLQILNAYITMGPCFTALLNNVPIAAAGVMLTGTGLGSAWGMISDQAKTMPFMLHRAVKRTLEKIIATHQLRRVDFIADAYSPTAIHWAKRLGFRYEAKMRAFYPDGHPALLFARITEDS
jgi:hypothetical protein